MATADEGAAAAAAAATAAGVRATSAVRHLFHLRDLLHRWHWPLVSTKPISDADADPSDAGTSCSSSTPSGSSPPPTPPSRALSSCPSCDLAHEGLIPPDVPEGCLAVYVGEEHRRFVIPASYLAEPAFGAMLQKAADEFGFGGDGALQLPCEVEAFKYILQSMEGRHHQHHSRRIDAVFGAAAAAGEEGTVPAEGLPHTGSSIEEEPAGRDLMTSDAVAGGPTSLQI